MEDVVLVKHSLGWGIDEEKVMKIAKNCIKKRRFNFKTELSLVFVGVKKARDLNIEFRKMEYIPQVLGFPNSKIADSDGLVRLGDVVICTRKLKREVELKENRGKDVYDVLVDWIEHGIDNLLK